MDDQLPTYDVYISYSDADKEWVRSWLLTRLEAAKLRVCIDFRDFDIGVPRPINIERAVDNSGHTLLVLTPSWVKSAWTEFEAILTQTSDPAILRRRLLPLLLEPCKPPRRIAMLTYADFTRSEKQDVQLERVVKAVRGQLNLRELGPMLSQLPSPEAAPFHVPFPHNPDFVGRDMELATLHEMLQQGQSPLGIRPMVLVGLGGIGKTQLAVAYAHAQRAAYPSGVFWLNAANPLLLEFADLAEKLKLTKRKTTLKQAAHKAWEYLDSRPEALIVFDNVLEPAELNVPFVSDFIPANLRCRTLFTTRQRDFPRTFQSFEVKILPEMAAMRLLLRARPDVLEEEHTEWGLARIVCASLGWLPLALELAAAYLDTYHEVTLEGYLERLRREGKLETVDDTELCPEDLPTRHGIAVRATLQAHWARLDDADAQLAFRAAGQFPEASWISTARLGLLTRIDAEAEPGHPAPLRRALRKLNAVSLIDELNSERLHLHPLVQEFAAQLSPPDFCLALAAQVATTLENLPRLQARVVRYGIDMVLEDVRTGLDFFMSRPESEAYPRLSSLERVLDRQAHTLRGWYSQPQHGFFLQQLRNESFQLSQVDLQVRAEVELAQFGWSYLCERFKVSRESPGLVRTLAGHGDMVNSVALSADGRLAVSAFQDKTLKVWDVATGRELRTLHGHSDIVNSVALSANGRLVISASSDKTLKVWDIATGYELRTLHGHDDAVNDVALSADGRLAVSASSDETLIVWDLATGNELCTLMGHSDVVNGIALSANGRLAVSASSDETLIVWDISASLKANRSMSLELRTLHGHNDEVNGVALSTDGRLAVSASSDQTLKVWEVMTGHVLRTLQGHRDAVNSVSLSPSGQLAASGAGDKMVKLWDVATGRELRTLQGHSNWVNGVALSANRRLAVSASSDETLKVWDISASLKTGVSTGRDLHSPEGHRDFVSGVALSAGGRLAISASWDKTLKVWDVTTGHELRTLRGHRDVVNGVALSADGRLAVSASSDKTLKLWDVATGRELGTLEWHNGAVNDVALSADGRLAVSASSDKTLKVWDISASLYADVATGHELGTFDGHRDEVNGVALSADGRLAVSASSDKTLKVWEVATGRELRTLYGHSDAVNDVALSSDGRLAISASSDETLRVWEVATGRELRTLYEYGAKVISVALSSDGRLAISALSGSQILKVWEVATGQVVSVLPNSVPLLCCAVTPDGKTIIAGDSLGVTHFLDLVQFE